MANFFVIFNRREQTGKSFPATPGSLPTFENASISQGKTTSGAESSGQLEDACILKLQGASLTTVAECQRAVEHFFPGLISGTPVVVTEAAFKES